jgi:tRNA(fMet)-specific endonuclease VapC
MPRFILDTCSYIMKRSHPQVLKRLQSVPVGDVCISVVTRAELLYGVEISPRRAQNAASLAAFLPYVEALDLPMTPRFIARRFGRT